MEKLRELYQETLEAVSEQLSQTAEYKEYIQRKNFFMEKLSEEQLVEFEMLMDMMIEIHDDECFENFVKGYYSGLGMVEDIDREQELVMN